MKGLKYEGTPSCSHCGVKEAILPSYINAMGQTFIFCDPCVELIEENEAIVDEIKLDIKELMLTDDGSMKYLDKDFAYFWDQITMDGSPDWTDEWQYGFKEHEDLYEEAFDELVREEANKKVAYEYLEGEARNNR